MTASGIIEFMKNMMRGLMLLAACAASAVQGGQPAPGVAGVDVVVRQNPSQHAVTDARGNFAFDALAPGSYTLAFKAGKAKEPKNATTDKVTIATTYSINVEGTKQRVNQAGLTSDKLMAGVDIPVQVAAGAKLRGQVAAGAIKKMVWIPKEPGSNIPGRWVEADSLQAKAAFRTEAAGMSGDGLRRFIDAAGDEHQEGFPQVQMSGGNSR